MDRITLINNEKMHSGSGANQIAFDMHLHWPRRVWNDLFRNVFDMHDSNRDHMIKVPGVFINDWLKKKTTKNVDVRALRQRIRSIESQNIFE